MENTPNTSLNTPEIDLQPEQIEINPPKNYSKVFIVGLILIASILIGIVIFLIKKPAEVLAPGPDMAQEETVNAPTNIPKAAVTGTETTDWLTYTDPKALRSG